VLVAGDLLNELTMSKRKSDLSPAGAATISPNFISPNLLNNKVDDEMTVQLLGAGQEVSTHPRPQPARWTANADNLTDSRLVHVWAVNRLDAAVA